MDENSIKITLGIVSTGTISIETAISLASIIGEAKWPTHTIIQRGCYVHENRERIVKEAQDAKSTHLFFMDSDMYVPPGTVGKLLSHDKMITGANYNMREFPLQSTVKFANSKGELVPFNGKDIPKTLFQCFATATGCMLINMKVFDIIDKPWFFFDSYKGDIMGEDIWFCRQAFRKGIKVWCDPTLGVKHIGEYAY